MRRARLVLAPLALFTIASAGSACALYFEEEPPELPEPRPPPPPPPPDTTPVEPPPGGVTAEIPIPGSLQGEDLFLDLVWSYENRPLEHDLRLIEPGTGSVSVGDPDAAMLAATLYTADGQIVDAALFRATCPGFTSAPVQTGVLEVPVDYGTIQAAVDAAAAGDVVYVHPGTYYERIQLRPGVHLVGAGAHRTVLDGAGVGQNLVEFTGAAGAVVRGFTLRNVGPRAGGCDSEDDALDCSGNWFAAAVYGDGHDPETLLGGCGSSVVLMHNVIEASDIGVLLYFHAAAAIRNNLFLENSSGAIATSLNERGSILVGNTLNSTQYRFLAADRSSPLDASNNLFANGVLATESDGFEASSQLACNVLFDVREAGELLSVGLLGNAYVTDPGFRDVLARDYRLRDDAEAQRLGCYDENQATSFAEAAGAYGGPLGDWYQRDITVEELKRFIE